MASTGYNFEESNSDRNVEIWKIKKLIKSLEAARGNGTSMISLIIPPKDQISRVSKMLADEFGTASNIKSRVNRLSVLGAITSVQHRLKLYTKVPANGLVIYCGTIVTEEGKEKKVNIDFEPFKPINTSLYLCDNKFHTEALSALLADDNKFGFIVMDGNGALFGTLQGNTREVLHKFTVDLPKKHGRGGQSALRFARLRMEKRHNYVRKVAEVATQLFISNDKPNIAGLILAGSADFKTELSQSDMFDPRLQAKVLKLVDVSYGGENGFNQAIELSAEVLSNVKFIQEKKLIGRYFDEISQDTGKFCFGVDDTLKALEMGSVEILIAWENLDIVRYELKNHTSDGTETKILHLTPEQEKDKSHFVDKETGVELELVESMPLLEWLANNYKNFELGATLEIITDKSVFNSQVKNNHLLGQLELQPPNLRIYFSCAFSASMEQKYANEFDGPRKPRDQAIAEFFCGASSGFINIAVTFPIHKIMFRQMLHGIDMQYAFNQIRKEGIQHLYRGCLPPLIQKPVSTSVMFGTNYEYGRFLKHHFPNMPPQVSLTAAALLAGSTEAILSPLERVQTLLQDQKYHSRFKNTFHAFQELRVYGFKEYYRGLTPILMRNGPSNVMFFGLKSSIKDVFPERETWLANLVEHFISGALIGASISTIVYPINVIKIKMELSCGTEFISFRQACKLTYIERDRSIKKMFYGVHVNNTRALLSWGIINASYELLKKALLDAPS